MEGRFCIARIPGCTVGILEVVLKSGLCPGDGMSISSCIHPPDPSFSMEEARNTYIYHIMRETVLTLQTTAGQNKLQDVGNFHEFCRMLSRCKNTFQLTEICTYSDSEQWLSAIGEFTVQGFHSWKVWHPSAQALMYSAIYAMLWRISWTDMTFYRLDKQKIVVAEQCSLPPDVLEQDSIIAYHGGAGYRALH